MYLVTVDSGTTNTRIRVWKDNEVIACTSETVGIRDVARTKNHHILIRSIKTLLDSALTSAGISSGHIDGIVASGMITSDLGLCHLPHLTAPVTLEKLAQGAEVRLLPEISPMPVWFIPGIKNDVSQTSIENCEAMDMMRGEEVEVFGLLSQHTIKGPALIVLPGSHTKLVKLDEKNQITGCVTTMAGEVLDVFTHQTVLSHSLQGGFTQEIDDIYLIKGAETCLKVGYTRAAFTVRILDVFTDASDSQRASFLLGVVLCADIETMKNSQALNLTSGTDIVICGKRVLREALAKLIRRDAFFTGDVIDVADNAKRPVSGTGALAVLERIQSRQSHSQTALAQ